MKLIKAGQKNFLKNLEIILNKRFEFQIKKTNKVKKIVNDIKRYGDQSVIKFEKKFSNSKKIRNLKFNKREINKVIKKLSPEVKKAINLSFTRIFKFHKKQKLKDFSYMDNFGNQISYTNSPIDRVGVYVPGGKASYPSTVLMNCIPAIVAGVKNIYMTTPSSEKDVNPGVIYAAKKCGVKEIYKIGGAQAISALAFGTKKIKKVDKIIGPGNAFVAGAKKEVFGEVGIDMIAGPSEVTVVADKFSNPNWVAADLIAQAEHDELSQCILITNNLKFGQKVNNILKKQLLFLPKKKIAKKSLDNFGYIVYAKNNNEIIKTINLIAPEHLEINLKKYNQILKGVSNAGSIFIGKYSAEAFGDYLAGPNHVLPTTGSAKFSSGLSVYDFLKRHSILKISKRGIERLGPSVIKLARYENLEGHAKSVMLRLERKT